MLYAGLMGKLAFNYGPMGSGKSTLALQVAHSLAARGWAGELLTQADRSGEPLVSSRMGATMSAALYSPETDFSSKGFQFMRYIVIDEAQFLTPTQVEDLGMLADAADVDVHCFGLLTDFRSRLFPGAARLIELADLRAPLPVEVVCSCGDIGVVNARLVDNTVQFSGETKVVGDTAMSSSFRYEVLCRSCYLSQRKEVIQ